LGDDEVAQQQVMLKEMRDAGTQVAVQWDALVAELTLRMQESV